jgi:outer membrane protein OmpA-like peptidoglycan-associated protein
MGVVFVGHERLALARLLLIGASILGIAGCDEALVGAITPRPVCTPSELRCVDESVQRCDVEGQWETTEVCDVRCMNGACLDVCDPGETVCQDGVFRTCTPQRRWTDVLCPTGCTSEGCTTGAPPAMDDGAPDGGPSAARLDPSRSRGASGPLGAAGLALPIAELGASRRGRRRARRRKARARRRSIGAAALLLLAAGAPTAYAQEPGPHRLHTELGAGVVVLDRDARDGWGGHAAIGYEYLVAGVLGFEGHLDAVLIPYDQSRYTGSGVSGYEALGAGPRLHLAPRARAVDLWVGGAVNGVRTGGLYRVGVSADLGLQFAMTPTLALGPVARYAHIFQPNDDPRGGEDGQLVEVALALRWAAPRRERAPEEEEAPTNEPPAASEPSRTAEPSRTTEPARPAPTRPAPTRPTPTRRPPPTRPLPPPAETSGAPRLRQRIEFASESARIAPEEEPKLHELREALARDRGIRRVRIVGHADDSGPAGFNQRLSEQRALAVLRWLARHGIRRSRLEAVGVGSSQPRAAGTSDAARQENRRVEIEVTGYAP